MLTSINNSFYYIPPVLLPLPDGKFRCTEKMSSSPRGCQTRIFQCGSPRRRNNDRLSPRRRSGQKLGEYWLLKNTLYGLCCRPRHRFEMITRIFTEIGLKPSPQDPCLFQRRPPVENTEQSYTNAMTDPTDPLYVGFYVEGVVYFSDDPAVKNNLSAYWPWKLKPTSWVQSTGSWVPLLNDRNMSMDASPFTYHK
jgi:hypothetical protein